MGDRLGIPGAVGSLPSLSFSPRPHVPTLGLPDPNPSWGWVARAPTPAADLGCLRAAREPLCIWLPGNQRTVPRVSVWGSLGVPQAIPGGLHQLQPQPQPQPQPYPQPHPHPHPPILAGERPSSRASACTHRYMCTDGACILFSYTFGGYVPGSGTAESYGTFRFRSFRNLHTLFHSGSTNSHSY